MIPVISTTEIKRLESLDGTHPSVYMENAGKAVAEWIQNHFDKKPIHILIGRGNNGGDALSAARHLKVFGFPVYIYALFPKEELSSLAKEQYEKLDTPITLITKASEITASEGIILIALIGTGFHGPLQGLLLEVIEHVNKSHLPILALDIPSGLNSTSGMAPSGAIKATTTLTLGFPKIGLFIEDGWNFTGRLEVLDFGLPKNEVQPLAYLIEKSSLHDLLPKKKRTQHKYEAGYVLSIAGSKEYFGAAVLSCNAALHSGAGIVSLFNDEETLRDMSHPEIIYRLMNEFNTEKKRGSALLIGPGLGRSEKTQALIENVLAQNILPAVIDADALYFLSKNPSFSLNFPCILTPHKQEMLRLLEQTSFSNELDFHKAVQIYANQKKCVLVLKGAPTWIFAPEQKPLICPFGDKGMATAGSGDVLSGILAAMLASKLPPLQAAILGVSLHGLSGELCAATQTSYSMSASDLIRYLPEVFKELLS